MDVDGALFLPLTVYERVRVVVTRVRELFAGAEPRVPLPAEDADPLWVATRELEAGHLGDYTVTREGETFRVAELTLPRDDGHAEAAVRDVELEDIVLDEQ